MNTIFTRNIAFVPVVSLAILAIVALCVSPASAALTHHWKLDETTGPTAADDVGSRDGTLVNFPDPTDSSWVTGKIGGALDFDANALGYGDSVDLGTSTVLPDDDPADGTDGCFTIMAWVKGQSFFGDGYHPGFINSMFSQWNTLSADGAFVCGASYGKIMMYQKGGISPAATGTTVLNTEQWYHMAFVKDVWSHGYAYLDGEEEIHVTTMIPVATDGIAVEIGAEGYQNWNGPIDDVRIYDTALTVEEIRAITGLRHPGDADNSGTVDAADAAILASNWLQSGKAWADGDFNEDTIVDDVDATIMAVNWGWSFGGAAAAAVPEPGTIVLLLGGILAVLVVRRK